ncbi:hypothetical protein HZC27_01390 [Candidatus Roizmanbacteria bacterium]|nr:hypothetical protein [Candidatus Roizmanbacteria bacterium]
MPDKLSLPRTIERKFSRRVLPSEIFPTPSPGIESLVSSLREKKIKELLLHVQAKPIDQSLPPDIFIMVKSELESVSKSKAPPTKMVETENMRVIMEGYGNECLAIYGVEKNKWGDPQQNKILHYLYVDTKNEKAIDMISIDPSINWYMKGEKWQGAGSKLKGAVTDIPHILVPNKDPHYQRAKLFYTTGELIKSEFDEIQNGIEGSLVCPAHELFHVVEMKYLEPLFLLKHYLQLTDMNFLVNGFLPANYRDEVAASNFAMHFLDFAKAKGVDIARGFDRNQIKALLDAKLHD